MTTQPSLVGRAITSGQAGASILTKSARERPYKEKRPELTVYLNMDLMEQMDDTFISSSTLKPGNSYYMFFNASNKSSNSASQSRELILSSNIELVLECKGEGNDPVNILIENPKRIMTYQQIALRDVVREDEHYEPFQLIVPSDCPEGMVRLCLYYIVTDAKFKLKRDATILQIKVDSPYTPYEKALKQCEFDITKPLPAHIAFLYVMQASSNTLHMTYGYDGRVFTLDVSDWQPAVYDVNTEKLQAISLADFAQRAKSSYEEKKAGASQDPTSEVVEEIRKTMRTFSRGGPPPLLKWLRELFQRSEEQLCFVIVDETSFEIPWEMLEVADEMYFGTQAALVRWSKVQLYEELRPLHIYEAQYQGSVLSYLNAREVTSKQIFTERETLKYVCGTQYPTLHLLVEGISVHDALKQVSLIYLGCHGNLGVALIGSSTSDKVTYIDFQYPVKHDDPRPIVFVNACNSARLKYSDGLRSVLLGRYASGYIGTLGEVISVYASKIAGCILNAALTQQNGIQVAELLRQLRAEVVAMTAKQQSIREAFNTPGIIASYEHRDLTQLSESEKNLYFLTAFMYVYYGNPLARLHLIRKLEAEGRGA